MLVGCGVIVTLAMFFGILIFDYGNKIQICFTFWVAGFFMVPIIPISMNFADELCFPTEATAV